MPWGPREVAVGIAVVAAVTVATVGLLTLAYRDDSAPSAAVLAGTLALEAAMLAVALAVVLGPAGRAPTRLLFGPRRLGTPAQFFWGAVAFTGSIVAGAIYVAVATRISEDLTPSALPIDIPGGGLRLVAFAVIVLIGPFAEEVFFRGFVLAGLLRRLGTTRAIIVSSALFAAAHLDLTVAGPAFLAGVVYALVYRRTGSLWPLVLAHTAQNAIAFALTAA